VELDTGAASADPLVGAAAAVATWAARLPDLGASGVRAGGAAIFVVAVRLHVGVKAGFALVKT
jgi:hypothetical protein